MRDNLNNEMILFFGNTNHIDYHIDFFKAGLNEIIISEYTRKLDTKEIKKLDISI